MSILQIEIPDETRQTFEERAKAQGRDLGSWALEQLEVAAQEQEEKRRDLAAHLLQHGDEPAIEATTQWWDEVLGQALAKADAKRTTTTADSV